MLPKNAGTADTRATPLHALGSVRSSGIWRRRSRSAICCLVVATGGQQGPEPSDQPAEGATHRSSCAQWPCAQFADMTRGLRARQRQCLLRASLARLATILAPPSAAEPRARATSPFAFSAPSPATPPIGLHFRSPRSWSRRAQAKPPTTSAHCCSAAAIYLSDHHHQTISAPLPPHPPLAPCLTSYITTALPCPGHPPLCCHNKSPPLLPQSPSCPAPRPSCSRVATTPATTPCSPRLTPTRYCDTLPRRNSSSLRTCAP